MEPEIGVSVFLSISVAKDGAKVAAMISSPLVRAQINPLVGLAAPKDRL